MSPADWRHDVNPRGKYMPGNRRGICTIAARVNAATVSVFLLCGLLVTKQWPATAKPDHQNTLGDSVDAGNHPAVALRTMATKCRSITSTFSVVRTPSFHQQRCAEPSGNESPAAYAGANSYIEGDVDIVSGRGAVVFITPNSAW